MTTFVGSFSGYSHYPDTGIWSGTVSLNITIYASGDVSGIGSLIIAFSDTDSDPITPSFSVTDSNELVDGTRLGFGANFFPGSVSSHLNNATLDQSLTTIVGTLDADYAPTNEYFSTSVTLTGQITPVVSSFNSDNIIDLPDQSYASDWSAVLSDGNELTAVEGGTTFKLQLDPAANFS